MNPNLVPCTVIIRNYLPGDEPQCQRILYAATMSTVWTAFRSALTREITLQLIVVLTAVMFIFWGLTPLLCLLSVPITALVVFVAIYGAHFFKAVALSQDLRNIPKTYMSSQLTGFWVAEVVGSPVTKSPSSVSIIRESDVGLGSFDGSPRRIIGTAAVIDSHRDSNAAWLRRMAVDPEFQKYGIASALIDEVIKFCKKNGYFSIELVTTECHEGARALYTKKGFNLRQLYHKQILFSVVQILMFEFTYNLL